MTEKLEEIQRRSAQIAREKTALLRAVVESKRTRQPAPDVVEAAAKAIMSYLFEACQPNRGDIFSWCDDHSTEIAQAAIAAILQDYAIIPKEPTESMLDAGTGILLDNGCNPSDPEDAYECYRAMIAAAPKVS